MLVASDMRAKKSLRLDALLVARGLAGSRERAQRLIRAGAVKVGGVVADKPGRAFPADREITVAARDRYVSRGGYKLEAALRTFDLEVRHAAALDVGASTGGFTDCLLQHGADTVYAVDVGYGQLDARLRNDPRVIVIERVNARYLNAGHVPQRVDVLVMDVSFISLRLTLPPAVKRLKRGGFSVTLIKPQFEAAASEVRRGGVVRDPAVHRRVLRTVRTTVEHEHGLVWRGHCPSPVRGPAGNIEFLALWEKP